MSRTVLVKAGFVFCLLGLSLPVNARDWSNFTPRAPSVKQSGHWEWNWDGSDGLDVRAPAIVHYVPTGPARIVINGPDEMLDRLRIGQGRIEMECFDCHFDGRELDITVSGVTLHHVAIGGSSEMRLGRLDQDRLDLAVSGSARAGAQGRIDQLDLTISGSGGAELNAAMVHQANLRISGSGRIKADGRIDAAKLSISGSGHAELADAQIRQADIHVSGNGGADLTPREDANVVISGSGTVEMASKPAHFSESLSGSGRVRIGK